ncbi:ABC transporter permease [Mesoplasma chauliocola]|uniref:ABC transporter permease n=1 Tax=Mesoplasma chauliocola TaxID=216427 RepID=A0A249SMI5_9MOLU|nr:ABC transporter permease [Mesoplasma chauliocola]ASZ08830.1 ABC transporter permease [Mesoplasma chauliocola]
MRLRLIIKQSWKDYKNKGILYLVFILFLTIVLGVILGIISFLTYAEFNLNQAYQTRYAGQIYVSNNLASQEKYKSDPSELDPELEFGSIIDKNGKLREYILSNIYEETKNEITFDKLEYTINSYIDFLGKYAKGNIENFSNWIDEEKINEYHGYKIEDIRIFKKINDDLDKNLSYISGELMLLYYYDTLTDFDFWAYPNRWGLTDEFKNSIIVTLSPSYENNFKTLEEYEEHPEFHRSSANDFVVYEDRDTKSFSSKDQEKIYKGEFVYVTPKYLEVNNLSIGDKVNYIYNDSYFEMIIKGTMITPHSTTMNDNQGNVLFDYRGYQKAFDSKRLNNQKLLVLEQNNSVSYTYEKLSKSLNENFVMKGYGIEPQTKYEQIYLIWDNSFQDNVFTITLFLLNKILTIVIIGLILVVFIVFYFMSENFLRLQRQTFYNLKAMGCNNFSLTLISSISAILPIIISFILSFFIVIPMSNMLSTAVKTAFSFYWPTIMITWKFVMFSFLILFMIFSIFLFNNFIVLSGRKSKINKFKESKKPSAPIIYIKKFMLPLPSRTRIGLSFALLNIAKNIYCFIILMLAFSVILFTFQFNVSVKNSANSMVEFAYPDVSIKYQSKWWDLQENKDEKTQTITYSSSNDQILGYDKMEDFIKIRTSDDFINMLVFTTLNIDVPHSLTGTSTNDLGNYILTGDYIWDLANSANSEESFNLILDVVILKVNKLHDDKIISEKNKNEAVNWINSNREKIWKYYKIFQDYIFTMKVNMTNLGLNETSQLPINLLFGKTFIQPDKKSYWSSGVSFSSIADGSFRGQATAVSASRNQNQKSFGKTSELYKQSTITEITMNNKTNAKALNVEISRPLFDRMGFSVGDTMLMSVDSLKTDYFEDIRIPIRISGIQKNDLLTPNVYFEKTDYFEVLKYTLLNRAVAFDNQSAYSTILDDNQIISAEWNSYLEFIDDTIKKSGSINHEDTLVLNNAQFSTDDLPVNLRFLTIPRLTNTTAKSESSENVDLERTDLLSYIDGDIDSFWSSKNGIYLNSISNDIWNYRLIRDAILKKAEPFQKVMRAIDQALVGMVIAISLVLISLILMENKNTIILFKSLGYRPREINKYLVTGYFISAFMAIMGAIVINKFLIEKLSPLINESAGISLVYVLSYSYILYAIILFIGFVFLVWGSIKIYTRRQKAKEIIT